MLAVRSALGKPSTDTSSPEADLNGDGIVNVLDAVLSLLKGSESLAKRTVTQSATISASAEQVLVEPLSVSTLQGGQVSVLFLIRNQSTPLVG